MPPFIMKIKFYLPGKDNNSKNVSHVDYIATRPRADRGDLDAGNRDQMPDRDEPGPAEHVMYAAKRPRSHGLFGPDHDPPSLGEVQKELSQHHGIVWRLVLSLREDTAIKMGYTERKEWEKAIRAGVPEAARAMGIPESNLRWVAAYHAELGHPHVHLVVWEKNPQRSRGVISPGERKDVRKAFIRSIYAAERSRLGAEKTAIRDMLRELAGNETSRARELVRKSFLLREDVRALDGNPAGVAPVLTPGDRKELARRLENLARVMPGKGRIALKYMPADTRSAAMEVADWLLGKPGFAASANRYREIAREMAGHYTSNKQKLGRAEENAYGDLRDRVAQVVLKNAAQVQKRNSGSRRWSGLTAAGSLWRDAWRAVERLRTREEARGEVEKREQYLKRARRRKQEQNRER